VSHDPIAPDGWRDSITKEGRTIARWLWVPAAFACFYVLYFMPALARSLLLAPADGEFYYLPYFSLSPFQLWNSDILSGFPVVSDIQAQTFYPLRWLSPTFNTLVVSAYVVAATGMFGLAHALTRSRLAALLAAFVFSGSGFMVAHLGHLSVIHAAAWVPAVLWALASLRTSRHWGPVAGGAIAVCLCLLGGHPQISVIGLVLAGCYGVHEILAVGRSTGAKPGLWMLAKVTALFALGIMLAAPTLAATLGSATTSVRGNWTLADFDSYSHTLETLRILVVPNLYGAHGTGPFGPYQGPWNLTELSIYAGVLPWFLMLAAMVGWRRDRAPWFWVGALVVGLLLTLGTYTPMGTILSDLPLFGRFRAQARFGFVAILALALLAAYGLSALLQHRWTPQRSWVLLGLCALCILGAILWIAPAQLPPAGESAGKAIRVALALVLADAAAILLLLRRPGFNTASLAIVLVVVDLGSFGWFYEWRDSGSSTEPKAVPAASAALLREMSEGSGRILPYGVQEMGINPLRPNTNLLHGISSVVGYGPLLSARYSGFSGADPTGAFPLLGADAPLLDVLAVRWLVGERGDAAGPQLLGSGCGAVNDVTRVRARIPRGGKPVRLRMVSHLGCSQEVAQGTPIADVRLLGRRGELLDTHTIDAGEETAEWAYDRPDVRASIAHSRPTVAEVFDAGDTDGLWFQASWDLPPSVDPGQWTSLEIELRDGLSLIRIKGVEIERDDGRSLPVPLKPFGEGAGNERVRHRMAPGLPRVAERLDYRANVWGVCQARSPDGAGIAPLLTSRAAAEAKDFDPHQVALLEPGVPVPRLDCEREPVVRVERSGHGFAEFDVRSDGRALLVVSESYNTGWRAWVDGERARVLPVNGLIQGVEVPEGNHRVKLLYRPPYFRSCVLLAALALLVIAVMAIGAYSPRRVAREPNADSRKPLV
jgi:hypothetical protein